jgi:HD-GYP domain-containing protein (c-di-GMP phosphodiesterase class II)
LVVGDRHRGPRLARALGLGGYPDGIASDPDQARVVSCCDAYNAMTTTRSYREARSMETALDECRRCAGSQFDADVVDALVAVVSRQRG